MGSHFHSLKAFLRITLFSLSFKPLTFQDRNLTINHLHPTRRVARPVIVNSEFKSSKLPNLLEVGGVLCTLGLDLGWSDTLFNSREELNNLQFITRESHPNTTHDTLKFGCHPLGD